MTKSLLSFCAVLAAGLIPVPGAAAENPYDVFARTIAPYAALLSSESDTEGLTGELELLSASEVDKRFHGAKLTVALQMPDKLRLTAEIAGQSASLIRNGQTFAATPAEAAREILNEVAPGVLDYTGSIQAEIPNFKLPVPRKQLAFLPALFAIKDLGSQEVDDAQCRVLELKLTPELARGETDQWAVVLWINPEYRPVLLELRGSQGAKVTIAVRSLALSGALPPETWPVEENEETLLLSPAQILQLLDALRGQMRM